MASSYDVINLSELAVPDAIVVPDAAEIFSRWLARLPDRWHVRIYPLLLIAVLLVMSVWG